MPPYYSKDRNITLNGVYKLCIYIVEKTIEPFPPESFPTRIAVINILSHGAVLQSLKYTRAPLKDSAMFTNLGIFLKFQKILSDCLLYLGPGYLLFGTLTLSG